MTSFRLLRTAGLVALVVAAVLPVTAAVASPIAPPPLPITGPRLTPPIPLKAVDLLVNAPLTINALEADAADAGRTQEEPGRGVRQTMTGLGAGLTLYDTPNVCNNFNADIAWSASDGNPDIWTDWYSGWGAFALDEGEYKADVVAFTRERSVGPGDRYNDLESKGDGEQYAAKIASHKPYAAGFGSPRIPVPAEYAGGKVLVSVKYLIGDHDQGAKVGFGDGIDYDWASLGIKPGADGDVALYANGYVRGEWAELTNTVDLGDAKDIMVLIQAQSPAFLNSNIYFDDIKVAFIDAEGNGKYLRDCTAAEAIQ